MNSNKIITEDGLARYVIPYLQNPRANDVPPESMLSAIKNMLFNESSHGAATLSALMRTRFDLFLQLTDNWQENIDCIPQTHWLTNPGDGIYPAIIPFIQRIQDTKPGSLLSVVAQQATAAGCQAIARIVLLAVDEGILEKDFEPFTDPKKLNVYVDTTTTLPTLTSDDSPLPFILFLGKLIEDAPSRALVIRIAAHFCGDQSFDTEVQANFKLIQALHQDADNPQLAFQTWVSNTWYYVDYEVLYENLAPSADIQLQPWFIKALKTLLSDESYIVLDDEPDDEDEPDVKQTLAHQLWQSRDGIKAIAFLNGIHEINCTDKTAWLRKVLDNCNSPYVICSVLLATMERPQQSSTIGSVFYAGQSNVRADKRLALADSLRETVKVGLWIVEQFKKYADTPLNEEVFSTYIFHKAYATHGKRKAADSTTTLRALMHNARIRNSNSTHSEHQLNELLDSLNINETSADAASSSGPSNKKPRAATPP
jgi:hypothetical protein